MTLIRSIFLALAIVAVGASASIVIDVQPASAGPTGGNGGGYVGSVIRGP